MVRWSLQVAVLLVLLSAGFNAGLVTKGQRPEGELAIEKEDTSDNNLVNPTPALEPREVVALQVASLAECRFSPAALQQVYAFASPDNREVTGPIDRFATMLLSPQYKPLVEQPHAVVGSQVVHDDLATVMVTAMDPQQGLRTFHFYLARESAAPYAGCWMTYGVVADPPIESLQPASPASIGI